MRRTTVKVFIPVLLALLMALPALAQDKATPKEVVEKVKAAAAMLAEKGEAGLDAIRDKNGPFVWKDSYVVATTMSGKVIAHPYNPKLEGKDMAGVKDAKGKLFQAEANSIAKEKGSGWFDFYWVKPGEKEPSPKVSFVMAVPGQDMCVNAGVYDYTLEQAVKESQ